MKTGKLLRIVKNGVKEQILVQLKLQKRQSIFLVNRNMYMFGFGG